MISVFDAVKECLYHDEIPLESMRKGLLNFSAYAKKIIPQIEKRTFKKVKHGTIVVALARLSKNIGEIQALKPDVKVTNLIIKSPLYEYTFDKSDQVLDRISQLTSHLSQSESYFAITQGISEVTLIMSEEIKSKIDDKFLDRTKSKYSDLVAITIRFPDEYLSVPNVIYSLVSLLATRRINLIEIVSTYTELSFIIKKEDMSRAIEALSQVQ
jgi:aspartokinase